MHIKPVIIDQADSTNLYAARLIKQGKAFHGQSVVARNQTSGKGLGTNRWESEPGKNLLVSFIVKPSFLPPAHQFMLNKVTSLATMQMIEDMTFRNDVQVKWPNDIYIGNGKAAGILINNIISGNHFEWAIVGVGINVNQKIFSTSLPNPVSMITATGKEFDLERCTDVLYRCFADYYLMLESGHETEINDKYHANLYRLGTVSLFGFKGRKLEATIIGVGLYGHLLLETSDGQTIECDLKEVKFL